LSEAEMSRNEQSKLNEQAKLLNFLHKKTLLLKVRLVRKNSYRGLRLKNTNTLPKL